MTNRFRISGPAKLIAAVLILLAPLLVTLTAASASAATGATGATAAVARPVIVLRVDGLAIRTGARTSVYRFGSDARPMLTQLRRALGGPLAIATNTECGQGPRRFAQRAGFSVLMRGNTFLGWFDGGAPGRHLRTAHGIGIGSTLASIRAVIHGVRTRNDTLGPEFFSTRSAFGGFLTGLTPASRAKQVYAGETCFFR